MKHLRLVERPHLVSEAVDDRVLVTRARAGDTLAFAALHERYDARVRRVVGGLLRSTPADVDDVVQEAWFRAHRSMPAPDATLSFGGWLNAVAYRCALDVLRDNARRAATGVDVERLVDPVTTPDRVAGRQALRTIVADLQAIEPRQRQVLVRHVVGGDSHASIADALAISPAASRALVLRARQSLARRSEARELPCGSARDELDDARRRGVRPPEVTRLHLQGCGRCRSYRVQMAA